MTQRRITDDLNALLGVLPASIAAAVTKINNNDELHVLLRLEAAIRVGLYAQDLTHENESILGMAMAQRQAEDALKELEQIRGNAFDAKAAYDEMLKQAKGK